jgi:multiple sugar transport system permease protein
VASVASLSRGGTKDQPRTKRQRPETRTALIFVGLAFIPLTLFLFLPILGALGLSFTVFTAAVTGLKYVGLENYTEVLSDPNFHSALLHTVQYVAETVPLTIATAFGFALLVHRPIRGIGFFRTAYYLPTVTSFIAVGVIWTSLFDPYQGLVGKMLSLVGLGGTGNWLTNPHLAMQALVLVSVWKNFGLMMLIYLAGLQGLPKEYFEAAELDGAGRFSMMRRITWPLLRPITFYLVIVGMISTFQAFDLIVAMTQGGPLGSTTTLVYEVYQNAFVFNRLGYASALAIILFVIILVISLINMAFLRDREEH